MVDMIAADVLPLDYPLQCRRQSKRDRVGRVSGDGRDASILGLSTDLSNFYFKLALQFSQAVFVILNEIPCFESF